MCGVLCGVLCDVVYYVIWCVCGAVQEYDASVRELEELQNQKKVS